MSDLKKKLIEQVDGLIRKGEISGTAYRTLITKIELADTRFLKMALDKFETLRKTAKEDEEKDKVKKADGTPAIAPMTTSTAGTATQAGAAPTTSAPAPAPATGTISTTKPAENSGTGG